MFWSIVMFSILFTVSLLVTFKQHWIVSLYPELKENDFTMYGEWAKDVFEHYKKSKLINYFYFLSGIFINGSIPIILFSGILSIMLLLFY